MKRVVVLSFLLVIAASTVFAQAGGINLFSSPAGVSCDLVQPPPGLWSVYAVHVLTAGATASQWMAPIPPCLVGAATIWLSDTPVFPVTIGNSQNGVAIGYGVCLASPIHILTINLFAQLPAPACCLWPVIPDPAVPSGQIEVVDCGGALLYGTGGSAVVNPDPTCGCVPPLATEETTWGALKAIYE